MSSFVDLLRLRRRAHGIGPRSAVITPQRTPAPIDGHSLVHLREAVGTAVNNNNSNVNYNSPRGVINNNNYVEMYVATNDRLADDLITIEKGLIQHHVPGAAHDTQPLDSGCMEGTRVELLQHAKTLVAARGGAHIVWIAGMAGTGKTSIALTLCQILQDDPVVYLGGTFFCSRSAAAVERTDVRRIVPTLATQLARMFPAYLLTLAAELKKEPDLAHKSIRIQVERLLIRPLDSLGSPSRQIVFVIDALDECSDHHQLTELVNSLADFRSLVPTKFLITARPDPRIRKSLIREPSVVSLAELHAIDPLQVTSDIQHYIHTRFKDSTVTSAWYAEGDVVELTRLADGLFVFAAVAIAYILAPTDGSRRSERLRKVNMYEATSALTPLETMYSLILTQATGPAVLDPTELVETRTIIAAIVSSRAPLSVKTLADLLVLPPEQLRGALDELHAVFYVPKHDMDGELRTLHSTFVDFLFTRAPEYIRIDRTFGNRVLADACLRRLAEGDLCFNISHCRSSYEPNLAANPGWIEHSLRYASLQWARHVELSVGGFDDQIDLVLRCKFLFWLELLSVIGLVSIASELLHLAASVTQSPALSLFLRDAISFVASFQEAIAFSASHIYISAIPFTPKDSIISQTFSPLLRGIVSVEISGINPDKHHRAVAAAISPDGRAVAVALGDGSVRVWDVKNNEEVYSVRSGHEGEVSAVTISADGLLIATGSVDYAVRLWDATKGHHVSLSGHNGRVRVIAFSPDGAQLASGSDDKTVLVWDVDTRTQLMSMNTSATISSLTYSDTGQLITVGYSSGYMQTFNFATGSWDRTFKEIWRTSDIGSDGITSLALVPDGSFIWAASGSNIFGLASEGESHTSIAAGHIARVNAIRLSRCAQFLASGADDATVRLWDVKTGIPYGPLLQGHAAAVLSVAFSPGNRSVVSVGGDGTIRIWNLKKTKLLDDQHDHILLNSLATAIYKGGWLVAPYAPDRRLLWVPPQHRGRLEIGGHSRVMAAHRVILTAKGEQLHLGQHWPRCWHEAN